MTKFLIPSIILVSGFAVISLRSHIIEKRSNNDDPLQQGAGSVSEKQVQMDALRYHKIMASCEDSPPNFDQFMAGNTCTKGNHDESICSVGHFKDPADQLYQQCNCDFPKDADMPDIVIPVCAWNDYTITSEEVDEHFPPTVNPFKDSDGVHVDPDTLTCGDIQPVINGYLHCEEATSCENRCHRGYVPQGIHNNVGVDSTQDCDVEEGIWSEKPFHSCVPFTDFCDHEPASDDISEDDKATVNIAKIFGATKLNSRIVGSLVVHAACRPDHWVFTNSKLTHVNMRCSCRLINGRYHCSKNMDSDELAALGVCYEPAWAHNLT